MRLSTSTYKIVNSPTQHDCYFLRTITARFLQYHHRLPFIPPSPLTPSPHVHSSLSYFHILSFVTVWPAGFTTLSLITAPGHMHEIAVSRSAHSDGNNGAARQLCIVKAHHTRAGDSAMHTLTL